MNMRGRKGFSLIELLVVIAIIGLLAGILLSAVHLVKTHARKVATTQEITQLEASWRSFLDDYRVFPPGITMMNSAAVNILNGNNVTYNERGYQYFEFVPGESTFKDRWGNVYGVGLDVNYDNVISGGEWASYPSSNEVPASVVIWSAGPDKDLGTPDDIVSWERD